MKKHYKIGLFVGILMSIFQYSGAQKQVERLDRGSIAVREGNGYRISWRLLADEDYNTGFNIYRGSTKLNDEPVSDVTSYLDASAAANSYYYVKAIVDGAEIENQKPARIINTTQGSNAAYFDIKLNRPATGQLGGSYSPNDASTGDLNGDGELDIVVKWDPNNSKDNSQSGKTDDVYLDGYTLDGEQLWRINLGPNIRAGAHYTQFLVFDFDGNGKAEIMVKTAPGTIDGTGNYIGKGPAASADHSAVYRNGSGYILTGPEYITVFDGETGEELDTDDYWPRRGSVSTWGDSYGNRVDRFNAAVAYVDGKRPSGVFQRGYYTRMTFAAWNWRDGELTKAWTFDSNSSGNGNYKGQGNHSIHVIDANGDGRHDIVTGSATISGTGVGMHTTGFGHGDACHVTYMKKGDDRPMIFMSHEHGGHGVSLRYADNGEMVFNNESDGDIGRGCAGELDVNDPGFKYWGSGGLGLYEVDGKKVGNNPNSTNFVIWWDGNLTRELMNSNRIDRWKVRTNSSYRLLTADNTSSNNGTKSTPNLQADLLGDWREEVILRVNSNEALRVFTTMMPTTYKLYAMMQDPVYRCQVSAQNSSYNQPPHPGFYMASDMDFPQAAPDVKPLAGMYRGSGTLITELVVGDFTNANDWEVAEGLAENASVYGNKTLFATPLPENLLGAEWIKTSTASTNWKSGDNLASFKVTQDVVVSIVIDKKIENLPEWMSDYTQRNLDISVYSPLSGTTDMKIIEKAFSEGDEVVLGPNASADNAEYQMYFVTVRQGNTTSVASFQSGLNLKIYPNPLKDEAKVEFTINKPQNVSIGVYDLNGKNHQQLVSTTFSQGNHQTLIDGKLLRPGMYIVQLITPETILQKKIMLIK